MTKSVLAKAVGLMAATLSHQMSQGTGAEKYQAKPIKQYLTCGANHNHNNSYCSAKCCKESS